MQKWIGIGRLVKNPELKETQSGIAVCNFTLAIDRPYKDDKGNSRADFIPVIVWRTQAENCGKYLEKGNQCAVVGSIQTRSYDDKDGNKRYVTEVVADSVEFLTPKSEKQEAKQEPKQAKQTTLADLTTQTPIDDSQLPF